MNGSSPLFFFNDTATTEIYTLSLHDALPISSSSACSAVGQLAPPSHSHRSSWTSRSAAVVRSASRSEEHTSELQSPCNLVCRLLLEKKKYTRINLILQLQFISDQTVYRTCVH